MMIMRAKDYSMKSNSKRTVCLINTKHMYYLMNSVILFDEYLPLKFATLSHTDIYTF
jgi:hypothetical protein